MVSKARAGASGGEKVMAISSAESGLLARIIESGSVSDESVVAIRQTQALQSLCAKGLVMSDYRHGLHWAPTREAYAEDWGGLA